MSFILNSLSISILNYSFQGEIGIDHNYHSLYYKTTFYVFCLEIHSVFIKTGNAIHTTQTDTHLFKLLNVVSMV